MDKLESGYGITKTGYAKRDFNSIKDYIDASLRSSDKFGADIDFTDKDPSYHFAVPIMELIAELWEVAEQVFYSASPKYAEGVSLASTGKYIGISKKQAQKASGICRFSGAPGTTISSQFKVKTDAEIVFVTTQSGTIPSIGYIDIPIEAVNAGASGTVSENTITKIVSPIIGLNSVTNPNATDGGQDAESDIEFREKYESSTASGAGSTPDAIKANILKVSGVTDCIVKDNKTNNIVDNIPPHTIYALVNGGSNDDIGKAILDKTAGGIDTYGNTSVEIIDSQGITQTISFSRPVQVNVWIKVTVTKDGDFPSDGIEQIKNTILEYISTINLGESVIVYKIIQAISNLGLRGLNDMDITLSSDGTTYSSSNLNIDSDKIAVTELAKIEVE